MAISQIIETPRLRIESFSERYLTERYVAWLNDPETTRFSDQRHQLHTLESCRRYLHSFEGTPHFFWAAVVVEDPWRHIGNLNAYLDKTHSAADVGILIGDKAARGQGYATEAWLGVCDYLLRVTRLPKVTAGTISVNQPMLNLMRRTAMVEDGRRLRHYQWNGQEVDVVHAAFFRDDWLKQYPNGPFGHRQ